MNMQIDLFGKGDRRPWLDLFCGAGGTGTGIQDTKYAYCRVGINHDPYAIESNRANHPNIEFLNDDIRKVDPYDLQKNVGRLFGIWMSAECTHYSVAKGGESREADSRALSDELFRYTHALDPEIVIVENVREFLSYGPLVKKRGRNGLPVIKRVKKTGKLQFVMVPEKKTKGIWYRAWIRTMRHLGYDYEYKLLNAADFGAYTSRLRYFGIFVKKGRQICWPEPTHAKEPGLTGRKKWKPVKEVLDLENHGESILYGRKGKDPLVKNTLARIEYGANKYFGKDAKFIVRPASRIYHAGSLIERYSPGQILSGSQRIQFIDRYNFVAPPKPLTEPLPTIMAKREMALITIETGQYIARGQYGPDQVSRIQEPYSTITADRHWPYLVTAQYLTKYHCTNGNPGVNVQAIDGPLHTIPTKDSFGLITAQFLAQYNGGTRKSSVARRVKPISEPLNTITTENRFGLATVQFLTKYYSGSNQNSEILAPLPTITTIPHERLVTFIVKGYAGKNNRLNVQSLGTPLGTITTNPDFNLMNITLASGSGSRNVGSYQVSDNIVDIKMRMLTPDELKVAQGFPEDYILLGGKTRAKKFVGNSVPPVMARVLIDAASQPYFERTVLKQAV